MIDEPGLSPNPTGFRHFAGCRRVAFAASASGMWANRADHFRYLWMSYCGADGSCPHERDKDRITLLRTRREVPMNWVALRC
jgi:hypothetical protein